MDNIWIECIRNKYRFEFKGLISAEDLFDLNLNDLDAIYKGLKRDEQDLLGDSLLDTADNPAKKEVEAKIDIVKSIFNIKKTEMENVKKAIANKAKKDKILAIIEDKQNQELSEKSIEELKKLYDSLD